MSAEAGYAGPVAKVLAAHHSSLSERDIAQLLERALDEASTDAPLSVAEEAFFAEHAGVPLADPAAVRTRRGLDRAISELQRSAASISMSEAAQRCGISESRLRHRIAAGEIYALPSSGRGRRLPLWQFTATGTLPHLREVLSALPDQMPAIVVEAFMTQPVEDLQIDDKPLSVAAWLAAGGGAGPVLELAASENASR